MAIKFEDIGTPAKKEVGDKTYVAEEPAPKQRDPEAAQPASGQRSGKPRRKATAQLP